MRHLLSSAALSLALMFPSLALAFPGETPDRFTLLVGGTAATLDTQAALGPDQGGVSAMLVFEDLFNLPIRERFVRFEGDWKFGDRSYLDLGYVNVDRAAARQIETTVEFGDYIFNAGAQVEATFKSRFVYAAYRHDFLQLEQVKIAGSAGLSVARMQAGLGAEGSVTDTAGVPVSGRVTEDVEFPLPIPLLGLRLDWAVADKHVINWYARAIGIDLGNIRGSIVENGVRYFWHFHSQAAIGAGYDRLSISLPRYETDEYVARFGYTISGFSVYLKGAF